MEFVRRHNNSFKVNAFKNRNEVMDEKEERIFFFLIYRENYFNSLRKVTMRLCEDLMTYNLFHPPTKELIKNL